MKLKYIAQVIDEDTDEVITQVSGYDEESLEFEMGKSKWTEPIKNYIEQNKEQEKVCFCGMPATKTRKEDENDEVGMPICETHESNKPEL